MYGLVNKAVQDLVTSKFGDENWRTVQRKAGVASCPFVGMKDYPDAVTYDLVGAASETLDLSPAQVLEAFGGSWPGYVERAGYGGLLTMLGDDLVEAMQNLDNLHTRVGLSFPELRPPSFRCTDVTETSVRLHYYSEREGLAPMVTGLLKSLGERFGTKLDVRLDRSRSDGADHDEFMVTIERA